MTSSSDKPAASPKKTKAEKRAAALRENLMKRKQQLRERKQPPAQPVEKDNA